MKKVVVAKAPHIFLFAKEYIKSGEELRYDYGDVKNMPWRTKAGISENLSEESDAGISENQSEESDVKGCPMAEESSEEKPRKPVSPLPTQDYIIEAMPLALTQDETAPGKLGLMTRNLIIDRIYLLRPASFTSRVRHAHGCLPALQASIKL